MTKHNHDPNETAVCASCAGLSSVEIDQQTRAIIDEHGHMVQFVFPTDEEEGHQFFYTVGRTEKGRPELLLTGPLDPRVGHWVLNEAAAMDDKTPLYPGQEIPANELLNAHPCRVVAADPEDAEMFTALSFYVEVTALQIIWPDMEGRFPGDPGFAFTDAEPVFPVH